MTFLPFAILFPVAWCGMHLYVAWRAASVPAVARRVPRRRLVAGMVLLATTYPVARALEGLDVGPVGWTLELLGMCWLGLLFLTSACLLAVEVVTGFGFLLPRLAPRLRGIALVAGVALTAIALAQGLRPPVIRDYEVRLAGLPAERDGTVLAVLTDMHLGSLIGEQWLAARVAQVEAMQPDAVVLVGDILEGDGSLEKDREFLPLLRRLTAPLGTWAVTGNHEAHVGVEEATRLFEEAGFRVLREGWSEIQPGLVLAGIADHHTHGPASDDSGRIESALSGRPEGVGTVFLYHRPQQAEVAARAGAGLMLSGHTHGGQIWPFGYVARIANPLQAGRYEVAGMPIVVSRGTGTWGPRMRLWHPGEILRVTLRADKP